MNYDKELNNLFQQLTNAFTDMRIDKFLSIHHKMSQLFTSKLQTYINGNGKIIQEINFNIPPDILEKMDKISENYERILQLENDKKSETLSKETPENYRGEK